MEVTLWPLLFGFLSVQCAAAWKLADGYLALKRQVAKNAQAATLQRDGIQLLVEATLAEMGISPSQVLHENGAGIAARLKQAQSDIAADPQRVGDLGDLGDLGE